jgi:hypothetical protein
MYIMNIKQHFKEQLDSGATTMFFYGLENEDQTKIEIKSHKGTLSEFPTMLEYIRHMGEDIPLFKVSL